MCISSKACNAVHIAGPAATVCKYYILINKLLKIEYLMRQLYEYDTLVFEIATFCNILRLFLSKNVC